MSHSKIVLTRAQAREADRIAIEEYGIPGVVLMENAGRNAAEIIGKVASGQWPGASENRRALIFCGPGNNAGDGYVIARQLTIAGFKVHVILVADRSKIAGDAATNLRIIEKMHLDICLGPEARCRYDDIVIVVDALLGTGSSGDPRPPISDAINEIIAAKSTNPSALVFAIDIPSGLDADTGQPGTPTVRADHTITFIAEKTGFAAPAAREYLGQVHVADIGIPTEIVSRLYTGSACGT